MRTARRTAAVLAIAALAAGLAGCDGEAPWATTTAAPATTPTEATPTEATATQGPAVNDLADGSLERHLQAGAIGVDVTYWSDLPLDEWTAGAVKPLSLALSATTDPDDGQGVYLQRASIVVAPDAGDALPEQADASTEPHGYLVLDPYSYSQTFAIGAVDAEATSVTVHLRYELLVQTTPTSDEYAKQTATDTLTIALAG